MPNHRFKDHPNQYLFEISQPTLDDAVLVVCPKCQNMAKVTPKTENMTQLSCMHCGFNKQLSKSVNQRGFYSVNNRPTDGYFGCDLWLITPCVGEVLWAFNHPHLDFLQAYVSATLRQRQKDEQNGWSNAALSSRLPKWIKSCKNRTAILVAIDTLKAKIY